MDDSRRLNLGLGDGDLDSPEARLGITIFIGSSPSFKMVGEFNPLLTVLLLLFAFLTCMGDEGGGFGELPLGGVGDRVGKA